MGNKCLRGGIRTTQFGGTSVYLFPEPGEGPKDFKQLESESLKRIFLDHFDFFRSGMSNGKVNGRSVSVNRTKGPEQRKIMKFSIDFFDITLLEDKDKDDSKALLFLDIPFHDPAAR